MRPDSVSIGIPTWARRRRKALRREPFSPGRMRAFPFGDLEEVSEIILMSHFREGERTERVSTELEKDEPRPFQSETLELSRIVDPNQISGIRVQSDARD